MNTPSFQEDHISQMPALQVLQNLGYTYLRPQEVILQRKVAHGGGEGESPEAEGPHHRVRRGELTAA